MRRPEIRRWPAATLDLAARAVRATWRDMGRPPLGWPLAAVIAACVLLGLFADRPAVLAVAERAGPGTRRFFETVTVLGDAGPYLAALSLGALACAGLARLAASEEARARLWRHAWNLWFVILAVLVSGAIHHALKIVVGRLRPRYLFSEDLYGLSPFTFDIARNSFPSGHTQAAVAVCFALYLVYPRHAALYLAVAALAATSRVMVLAHYPSDVLGGAWLAICVAILLKRHYLDPRLAGR